MIQEIIVYIIGIAVVILLLSKIYKALFSKKDKQGLDCSCGCNVNKYRRTNRMGN